MLINDVSSPLLRFDADRKTVFLQIACILQTITECFTIALPNVIKGTKYDSKADCSGVELPTIVNQWKTKCKTMKNKMSIKKKVFVIY